MTIRRAMPILAATAVLTLVGCGSDEAGDTGQSSGSDQTAGPRADAGEDAPAEESTLTFTATTVDGEDFNASSLEGEPAVFWFWAPWCPTCAAQADDVTALAEEFEGRAHVVGVASLGGQSEMVDFVERTDTSGLTHLNDEIGTVWQHYGITAQSTFALVDSDGVVTYSGYLESDELADRVAELVG